MSKNQIPNAQTIRRHLLDNGITVLIYENPASRTVVLEGGLWAGSVGETRATAGLASMTAGLLLRGTTRRTFEQIFDELEGAGASLSFTTGYQMTEFSGEALAEDLDLLLELLADGLRRPTFPAEHVEKVRAEKLTGVYQRNNDTAAMARLAFHELLYGDHPYGRSVGGYADSLPTLDRAAVAAFYAQHYGPEGMILTLVGGIDAERALERVAAVLGDWRNPERVAPPAVPDVPRPTALRHTHYPMPGKTQSDIMLGLPGPLRSDPAYTDVKLANTILGVFGMMGRLGHTVREQQGLAYYARSVLRAGLGPLPWYVSTGVAPDKVEQALESIRAEIRRLQEEPVSAEELADSQAYLTGSLPMAIETNGGIADIVTDMELYNLGLDYLVHYAGQINAVTPERVQSAAQRHFSADEVAVAVAGPA